MANTYSQSYFHLVFAPKNHDALIMREWKNELEKYITAVIQNHKHKLLAIGSVPDHIHILIGYNLNHLIPDLVEEIKTSTNKWIRDNRLSKFRFEWQVGYGSFTISHSQIDPVVKYILTRRTIIINNRSGRNILKYWIRIMSNIRKNIFSIFLIPNQYNLTKYDLSTLL
jgi:putative transposase